MLHLPLDNRLSPVQPLGIRAHEPQQLGGISDRRQRITQFMAQHRKKFVLVAVRVVKLLIQLRIVQSDSCTVGQILQQQQIRLTEHTADRARRKAGHAHNTASGDQREHPSRTKRRHLGQSIRRGLRSSHRPCKRGNRIIMLEKLRLARSERLFDARRERRWNCLGRSIALQPARGYPRELGPLKPAAWIDRRKAAKVGQRRNYHREQLMNRGPEIE